MTLITLDDAEQEFTESVAYYESRESGLGSRFRDEVAAVSDWILRFPEVPRLRPKGYRRVNLRAFPHYVAYILRGDTIWVVAIAHGHRRPEFWIDRI
jgi:plasmid stabilization system protein ParE